MPGIRTSGVTVTKTGATTSPSGHTPRGRSDRSAGRGFDRVGVVAAGLPFAGDVQRDLALRDPALRGELDLRQSLFRKVTAEPHTSVHGRDRIPIALHIATTIFPPPSAGPVTLRPVARNPAPTASQLRHRLSAWARYVYVKNRYASVSAMAKDLPHNQGALNEIINGKGTTGIEFAVKLALAGQESLDTLCLRDPPPEYFRPGAPGVPIAPGVNPVLHEPEGPYRKRRGPGKRP